MIAIDVMGGDQAPGVVLEGAVSAAKKSIPITLFGPARLINDWLAINEPLWTQYPIAIADSNDVIAMDEEPVLAVRKKTSSSLVRAVASVAGGQSSAVLSAGNSGAFMIASTLVLGRQEGIERPAIAGFLPTTHGNVLALDLGANTECRAYHLVQFAQMGSEYLNRTMGVNNPTIALLSNGHEEGKGSQLVKEAYGLLKQSSLNFVGNAEPYDVFEHKVDIVVCDGFSGNILLKTLEAVCSLIEHKLGDVANSFTAQLGYKKIGGAMLLGVKGQVVVCHGNSDAQTLENAITFAWSNCK